MDPPHDDDDIQFDFFDDEPVTAETPASRVRLPRRSPRPSRGGRPAAGTPRAPGTPRGAAPLVQLAAAVFIVLLLILFFAVIISSCTSTSKHDSYGNYMEKVATISAQSTNDGQRMVTALTTNLTVAQLVTKMRSLALDEQQNVKAAESIVPPGRLRMQHGHLIEALQLRVSGITGLADTLQKTPASSTDVSAEASLLSEQAERLLASDIVWDDLFRAPSLAQLKSDGVTDVQPPESHVLGNPDLVLGAHAWAQILQRLSGTSTGGTVGKHGTNIVSVTALPNGVGGTSQTLAEGTLNTVTTSSSLVFQVTIHNGGDSQEVQIPVTLVIGRPAAQGGPIRKDAKVQLIDPGTDQSVTFTDLGQVPFASQTTVSVDVAGVPGELTKSNNSAQYKVIFSLPS